MKLVIAYVSHIGALQSLVVRFSSLLTSMNSVFEHKVVRLRSRLHRVANYLLRVGIRRI